MMRLRLVTVAALAGLFACADRAPAQVVYYNTPLYYNSPYHPYVRTYSMPVMYSTYTSPVVVPTRFVDPPFGTVGYTHPPAAAAPTGTAAGTAAATAAGSVAAAAGTAPAAAATTVGASTGVAHAGGFVQPFPAFRQVGYSTYSTAPVPIGGVYYSGDAYVPPSYYRNTPYDHGPGMNYNQSAQGYNSLYYLPYNLTSSNYGAYVSPYFQVQFGQGYGGWGWGRGWGGWGWSW